MSGKNGYHRDAVHGAGRQAQLAAGTFIGEHRVHQLARAEYRIHRADVDALATADADGFVDDGADARPVPAETRIERFGRGAQQSGQRPDRCLVARRALIDVGLAAGHGLGVRAAARIAAQGALRLRQPRIDPFRQRVSSALFEHDRKVWSRFTVEATAACRQSSRCGGDLPLSGAGGTGTMNVLLIREVQCGVVRNGQRTKRRSG